MILKLPNVEEELKLFKQNRSSETPTVKINDFKEVIEKPNLSSDKDIENGHVDSTEDSKKDSTEDLTEDSTEEENDSGEVFPHIELSMISDEKEEGIILKQEKVTVTAQFFLFCDQCSFKCIEDNIF